MDLSKRKSVAQIEKKKKLRQNMNQMKISIIEEHKFDER